MRNLDPMKCVAQGAAIISAVLGDRVECPACGATNDKGSDICSNCGKEFPVLLTITAEPYGIQTMGDKFVIIIPKGTNFPHKPEPSTFYTRRNNQRRIKVPVYCGNNPQASKNEWQQTLWMPLPPNLPGGTRVEVSMSLGNNGILDSIQVKLMDGSGRKVEAVSARGEDERGNLEKKIEEAARQYEEKIPKADHGTILEMEGLYDELVEAANAENFEAARKKLEHFQQRVGEIGVEEIEWKRRAQNMINYAEEMIRCYERMMSADGVYALKKLVEESRGAIRDNNQTLGTAKIQEIDKKTDDFFAPNTLMLLRVWANSARRQGQIAEADALGAVISRAEDAAFRGDSDAFNGRLDEAVQLIKKIKERSGEMGKFDHGLLTTQDRTRTPTSG